MKPFNNSAKFKKDNSVEVKIFCSCCNNSKTFNITRIQYEDWQNNRRLVQDIFPDMDKDMREMFITGICPSCWNKMFSEE